MTNGKHYRVSELINTLVNRLHRSSTEELHRMMEDPRYGLNSDLIAGFIRAELDERREASV